MAPILNSKLRLPTGGINSDTYLLGQFFDLAKIPGIEDPMAMQSSILNNIDTRYPKISGYIHAIISEQLNTQDTAPTQIIKATADMYSAFLSMKAGLNSFESQIEKDGNLPLDESGNIDRDALKGVISAYIKDNPNNPGVRKYLNDSSLLQQFQAVGLDIPSIGNDNAKMAYDIYQSNEDNFANWSNQLSNQGLSSVLQSDILSASLDEEYDLYSAFATNPLAVNNNEMTSFLGGEASGIYTNRANKLRSQIGDSNIDEKADAIAAMFGVATWENYNNVGEFKLAIEDKIKQEYGSSKSAEERALNTFNDMWLTLVSVPSNKQNYNPLTPDEMTLEGLVKQGQTFGQFYPRGGMIPGSYAPERVTHDNPLEILYGNLDAVKESLNSLSILGVTDDIMSIEDILYEERNK